MEKIIKIYLKRKQFFWAVFLGAVFLSILVFSQGPQELKRKIQSFQRELEYGETINSGLSFYTTEKVKNFKVDSYLFLKKISEFKKGELKFDPEKVKKDYADDAYKRLLNRNDYPSDLEFSTNLGNDQGKFVAENFPNIRNHTYYLATGDFYRINKREGENVSPYDDVMLRALYCDVSGYNENDFSYLQALEKGDGNYMDTHLLFSLIFLKANNCYDQAEIEREIAKLADYLVVAQNSKPVFSDVFAERIVFLYWAGKGEMVRKEWFDLIKQNYDKTAYGWRDRKDAAINEHTTGLALLALLYYVEGKNSQDLF